MAGNNPFSEFLETFADKIAAAVELHRRVDAVANVHVDAEGGAVDGADQLEVGVGAIGDVPAHHLDGEAGAAGLDLIDDTARVPDGGVEKWIISCHAKDL